MGSVYDVEDVTVEKRYVLKTLHPQLVSRDDLARRMRDEAKALAKLSHPNIVEVITAGVTSDAVKMPFYVMERLIGQNLRVVLEKKGALAFAHAYRIAIDVADALEHAHENNIIHRDVKPENIFLHRNANGTTTTKLLDFGIVRLLDRKASHTHGKFIGTLKYASPEQITGSALGPATDIYSLGVVLFEMLAGGGPFDDVGDAYAIGSAHAKRGAPSLSRFVHVPERTERLVASALAKEPDLRPRDCFAFANELRRLLSEEEAAPRSATIANVLSVMPTIRDADSESEATRAMHATPTSSLSLGPTVEGVTTPVSLTAAESTTGVVSPIAPTLAAAFAPSGAKGGVSRREAEPEAAGAATRASVDRSAPTRESAPSGWANRVAHHDTQRLDPRADQPHRPGQGPHAALGLPGGGLPLAAGPVPDPVVAAPTGPTPIARHGPVPTGSREARARTLLPAEYAPIVLVAIAAVLAIAMVTGAALVVRARKHIPPAAAPMQQAASSR
jgi:serine/threonine protein kinase